MTTTTPEPPPTRDDSTLQDQTVDPTSTGRSIKDRHSASSEIKLEKALPSEKTLEAAPPAYDESKILHGKKLFFAFVAMLLSVLLIALGMSFCHSDSLTRGSYVVYMQIRPLLRLLCENAHE
jgi:hypothetical protein